MADSKEVLYSKLAFLLAVTASDNLAGDIATGIKGANIFEPTALAAMLSLTGFDKKPGGKKAFAAIAAVRAALTASDLWPDDECDWCTIEEIFDLPAIDCPMARPPRKPEEG